MPTAQATVNAIPLFGAEGWASWLVGYPQGEGELEDTCDSRWPSLLNHGDDPQLAEWNSLSEGVATSNEEQVFGDDLPSLVRADDDDVDKDDEDDDDDNDEGAVMQLDLSLSSRC